MRKLFPVDLDDYHTCANCLYVREVVKEKLFICKKRGSISQNGVCRHFKLDLLALHPRKLRNASSSFTEKDFTL